MQKTLAKALFTKTLPEKGDKEKCKFLVLKQDAVFSNKELGLAAGAENFSISNSGSCSNGSESLLNNNR